MIETVTLQWTPAHDSARTLVFEPADDTWQRSGCELHESRWRHLGTERVETVSLTCDGDRLKSAHPSEGDRDA
jgi:hypothetical protein